VIIIITTIPNVHGQCTAYGPNDTNLVKMASISTAGIGGCHDLGGASAWVQGEPSNICLEDKALTHWEKSVHALLITLASRKPALMTTDELRRGVESLEPESYRDWTYYERWVVSMTKILLERQVVSQVELDEEMGVVSVVESKPCFHIGDRVKVKKEDALIRWRKPHLRCPGYIFDCEGVIEQYMGAFNDPAFLAFRGASAPTPLYRVSFRLVDVWGSSSESTNDRVVLDIYQPWLQTPCHSSVDSVTSGVAYETLPRDRSPEKRARLSDRRDQEHTHEHSHEHEHTHKHACEHVYGGAHENAHEHEHAHEHAHDNEHSGKLSDKTSPNLFQQDPQDVSHERSYEPLQDLSHEHSHDHAHVGAHSSRAEIEANAVSCEGPERFSPGKFAGDALFRLLHKKGIVTTSSIQGIIDNLENASKNLFGADLVVSAWLDDGFRARLLEDGK
jgi:hypothetical protein